MEGAGRADARGPGAKVLWSVTPPLAWATGGSWRGVAPADVLGCWERAAVLVQGSRCRRGADAHCLRCWGCGLWAPKHWTALHKQGQEAASGPLPFLGLLC